MSYFDTVYEASVQFVRSLSLPPTADPLPALLGDRKPEIESRIAAFCAELTNIGAASAPPGGTRATGHPAGLNTVGMLSDRLTVLVMKGWSLEFRQQQADSAGHLRKTQVQELLDTLARIRPGHSSFTLKLTKLSYETEAATWEAAYSGLLATNILLWEAQEILYAGKLDELPADEIRRYIAWFSEGNIRRNNYIALCEQRYWEARDQSAG